MLNERTMDTVECRLKFGMLRHRMRNRGIHVFMWGLEDAIVIEGSVCGKVRCSIGVEFIGLSEKEVEHRKLLALKLVGKRCEKVRFRLRPGSRIQP